MPKQKTKGSVKKRFKLTAKGKVKRRRAMHSHILTKKAPGRKRRLRKPALVDPVDEGRIKRMMG
jgi:large subunit ribosomal protein L35